jgi:hypothetical protein
MTWRTKKALAASAASTQGSKWFDAWSEKLTTSCDPGWDVPSASKPMRNVVLEVLDGLHGNRAAVEGFALVLSGYTATSAAGCAISARDMRTQFRRREAAALHATSLRVGDCARRTP